MRKEVIAMGATTTGSQEGQHLIDRHRFEYSAVAYATAAEIESFHVDLHERRDWDHIHTWH